MSQAIPLAVGYEAEILVERDPSGQPLRVVKRYSFVHPAVRWLNERLGEWYDPAAGLPVAQHEWAAYMRLEPEGCVPPPLKLLPDAIVLGWGGEPLHAASPISTREYRRQAAAILTAFARVGVRHNDLLERNVLIDQGRVRVIDFTMAEFGLVHLMDELPDPAWARPNQDHQLLDLLRTARRRRRSPATLLKRLRPPTSATKNA